MGRTLHEAGGLSQKFVFALPAQSGQTARARDAREFLAAVREFRNPQRSEGAIFCVK
jgi:hypothetical protein